MKQNAYELNKRQFAKLMNWTSDEAEDLWCDVLEKFYHQSGDKYDFYVSQLDEDVEWYKEQAKANEKVYGPLLADAKKRRAKAVAMRKRARAKQSA